MTKKTIAVVGITGNQVWLLGCRNIRARTWLVRQRHFTRSIETLSQGIARSIDVVATDLDLPGSMGKAFSGANVIFGATGFVQHLLDSGTTPIRLSHGKIQYNLHFDCKWAAVEYLKENSPELWKKTSLLQLGIFASNWKIPYYTPRKQEDGTYKLSFPMDGEEEFSIIDPNADTGNLVKGLFQIAPSTHLVGATSMITWDEWCKIWSRVNEVNCTFERLDRSLLEDAMGPLGREIADMFQYMDELGYDGSDPTVVYPWDLGVKVKTTPIDVYLADQDWSSVL
ncbi:hypothetical protein BKA61DRAFT_628064 [Leptodontidium sp. MPI-SDFR-AT-0119]|nr:hypothetical protein BKA61DRAFT_628064 [Leptodontidium sp. MPI-SDFR-AT-0119]